MLLASEDGQEIDGRGHSHGGDMSQVELSILEHVSFFGTYYFIHHVHVLL